MEPQEIPQPKDVRLIKEGKAEILFSNTEEVFYNPVQEYNRDLSIAVIRTWAKEFISDKKNKWQKNAVKINSEPKEMPEFKVRILEALSATGLRSVRYGLELQDIVRTIVANDISPTAVEAIKENVLMNGLTTDFVVPNKGDATAFMYSHREGTSRFDVIDVDPYGTASPFIDAAIQSVSEGGLLCITCTDLAVLAGKYPETCFAKYGGAPLRSDACHEIALRLLLQTLQTSAARYKRVIEPLISCSIDFYIRVFVRVYTSPAAVKYCASKIGTVYQCSGCKSLHFSSLNTVETTSKGGDKFNFSRLPNGIASSCNICGGVFHIGGPMYLAPIHNKDFVKNILTHLSEESSSSLYGTHSRMKGMMTVISEEINAPLYYSVGTLSQIVKTTTPSLVKFNSALLNAGYQISLTHCAENCVKTDAPPAVIWEVMKAWAKEVGATMKSLSETSPGYRIRTSTQSLEISFEEHEGSNPESRKISLVRFENHVGMNWGPKARAKPLKRKASEMNESNELNGK